MVEGVAMATARNLLGEQPTERLRVWFHNGEDTAALPPSASISTFPWKNSAAGGS
jgi:hypothetical protein